MQHQQQAELFGHRGPHSLVAAAVANARDSVDLRPCAIKSAIFWALEDGGHKVEVGRAIIDGEPVTYTLHQSDGSERWGVGQPLVFAVEAFNCGRQVWIDKPGKPLEAHIPSIVRRFVAIARGKIAEREREIQWQREHEAAQRKAAFRYYKELEREVQKKTLHRLARNWRESARLTEFLNAMEPYLAEGPSDPAMAEWFQWARRYTAGLNPFSPGSLRWLQHHAEAVAHHPIDDEEPDPYEVEWRQYDELYP